VTAGVGAKSSGMREAFESRVRDIGRDDIIERLDDVEVEIESLKENGIPGLTPISPAVVIRK